MTGAYLEKLRALKAQKGAVGELPKVTKVLLPVGVTALTPQGKAFDTFGTAQGAGFSDFPARYRQAMTALEGGCPYLVPVDRWQQCVADAQRFLARWGDQAEALGWTARDLFGLHRIPDKPHPSYRRLSRYDCTGLVWLLQGRSVVVLTADSAAIMNATGAITTYRKHNKPALGPVGDALDDLQ
jgi:hypothetical protein